MNGQNDKPVYLSPVAERIPEELKAIPRWVLWKAEQRDGRWTKVPYRPNGDHAKSNDSKTFSPFDDVLAVYTDGGSGHFTGVGFVLNGDGVVAVDFDKCRCPAFDGIDESIAGGLDMVLPEVAEQLRQLDAYTEVSPGKKGIRVILKGTLPVAGTKRGPIEAYQSGRYVTITGRPLKGFPLGIEDRSAELLAFYAEVFGKKEEVVKLASPPLSYGEPWRERLERAFVSKNGPAIKRLYDGDYSRYPSQSEADMALTSHLAFWLDGDVVAMDEAFRSSKLIRPKWDEKHYGDGRTYGQGTIEKAILDCEKFCTPRDGGENEHREFHFRAASELCKTPTPTDWIVEHYLNAGSLGMIFGEPGSMKSFLAIDIGLCVATGHDWNNCKVKQGAVFYIAGEGFGGINRRIMAWSIDNSIDMQGVPFFISDRPARILDKDGGEEVTKAVDVLIEEHGKPVLVIIDTLNRNFGSGDENSTKDMTRFIITIDALRRRYGCAVLIIHHSGLATTERARGASALKASLDWEYQLSKTGDNGSFRTMKCTKAKDFEAAPTISFEPSEVQLDGWTDGDEPVKSCVLIKTSKTPLIFSASNATKVALTSLKKLAPPGKRIHITTWRKAAYADGISKAGTEASKRKAFSKAYRILKEQGVVDCDGNEWWLTELVCQGNLALGEDSSVTA